MWTKKDLEDITNIIVKKAENDQDLIERFKERPAEVIKEYTGKDVPEGFEVKLLETNNIDKDELTDEELDKVSGGFSLNTNLIVTVGLLPVKITVQLVGAGGASGEGSRSYK